MITVPTVLVMMPTAITIGGILVVLSIIRVIVDTSRTFSGESRTSLITSLTAFCAYTNLLLFFDSFFQHATSLKFVQNRRMPTRLTLKELARAGRRKNAA